MLLGLYQESPFRNLLTSLFVWVLLAGYIVFPATFNNLHKSSLDEKVETTLQAQALRTAHNVTLLYVAAIACAVGIVGCLWLWWKHHSNYVWVISSILPSLLNSIAELVSKLVNVYSIQDGKSFRINYFEKCRDSRRQASTPSQRRRQLCCCCILLTS